METAPPTMPSARNWLRERPVEPILPGAVTPDSELRLAFTEAPRVWELITELLPSVDQLPAPVER
ncbi:hypothetical protein ACQP2K_07745 [Microbispora siamensis]